jgi:hypothetical protein
MSGGLHEHVIMCVCVTEREWVEIVTGRRGSGDNL